MSEKQPPVVGSVVFGIKNAGYVDVTDVTPRRRTVRPAMPEQPSATKDLDTLNTLLRKLRLDLEAYGATLNAMRREVNRYRKALRGARHGAPTGALPTPRCLVGPDDQPAVPD